ncbi:hypothetical protein BCR34DRAFT_593384 [Clohesyomyces aquaticus]|uniref:Uncharacterized protein n=1 Tax=Clohesyomyces aquaticus TaxID=1231657 RepID=A0A1Y1YJ76_9PLEO|nr:hypothetical protein BCR34DRAFT_593384 [Clohesyomyces aquaticus]
MAVVQDPSFWRRFSMAAHLDEEAQRPGELKHSYVNPLPSPPNTTSTSTTSHHNTFSVRTSILTISTLNPFAPPIFSEPASPVEQKPNATSTISPLSRRTSSAYTTPSFSKQNPGITRTPSKLSKPRPTHQIYPISTPLSPNANSFFPPSPRNPCSPRFPFSHANVSTLTFSGRNSTRFKFWTSVSAAADPRNRESWLEQQRKKKSKRTCMCWVFWLVLIGFVAGIVIVILFLKAKGII